MTPKRPQIQLNTESQRRNKKLAEAVEQIVRNTPGVPKYVPGPDNASYITIAEAPKRSERVRERDLPVPPEHLYLCFEDSQDVYLHTGRVGVEVMRSSLAECGFVFPPGSRVLDFGCGSGRMIRWFCDVADRCEVWGSTYKRHTSIGARRIWRLHSISSPARLFRIFRSRIDRSISCSPHQHS
jgi:hypothetical protein